MPSAKKSSSPKPEVIHLDRSSWKGSLKHIGGSMSDEWNIILANQTIHTLWLKHSDQRTRDEQLKATAAALIGIAPKNEIEGMIAAQLLACHSASMECYRRAMLDGQTFEGCSEYLSQANKLSRTYAVLLDALNRHRGKGQQKVTVEHVHVHAGGQAVVGMVETPGGWGTIKIRGTTPCKTNYPCTSAGDVERGRGAGAGASRRRCRTAGAGCTAECPRRTRPTA